MFHYWSLVLAMSPPRGGALSLERRNARSIEPGERPWLSRRLTSQSLQGLVSIQIVVFAKCRHILAEASYPTVYHAADAPNATNAPLAAFLCNSVTKLVKALRGAA